MAKPANTEADGIYYGYYIDTISEGRIIAASKQPDDINTRLATETRRLQRRKTFIQSRSGFVIASTPQEAAIQCRRNNFLPKRWAHDIAIRVRVRTGDLIANY